MKLSIFSCNVQAVSLAQRNNILKMSLLSLVGILAVSWSIRARSHGRGNRKKWTTLILFPLSHGDLGQFLPSCFPQNRSDRNCRPDFQLPVKYRGCAVPPMA
eukprot:Gb_25821 [translate_table: standard]